MPEIVDGGGAHTHTATILDGGGVHAPTLDTTGPTAADDQDHHHG